MCIRRKSCFCLCILMYTGICVYGCMQCCTALHWTGLHCSACLYVCMDACVHVFFCMYLSMYVRTSTRMHALHYTHTHAYARKRRYLHRSTKCVSRKPCWFWTCTYQHAQQNGRVHRQVKHKYLGRWIRQDILKCQKMDGHGWIGQLSRQIS